MGQYVALLDILGFKEMITNNPHDEIVHQFDNFLIYVQKSLAKDKTMTDSYGRLTYDVSDSTINSTIISDSLLFWTNDNSANGLFELIECLQSFTSFCHNLPHIYLRGGITYGDFYYDNNGIIKGRDTLIIHPIMVGKALVDVYEIEKKLQIAGCIITNEAIQEAKNNNYDLFEKKWNELITENKILEYHMPTKKDNLKAWTINWVRDMTNPDLDELIKGFSSFNKGVDDPGVKAKIKNTVDYYLFVKNHIFKKSQA